MIDIKSEFLIYEGEHLFSLCHSKLVVTIHFSSILWQQLWPNTNVSERY